MEVLWYAVRARRCARAALVSTHYRPESLPDSQAEFGMKVKLTLGLDCLAIHYLGKILSKIGDSP